MGKKYVAVVCADTHLSDTDGAWASRPIRGDARHSFTQVVDLAIRHQVSILAAGDLLDAQRNRSGPLHFLQQQLGRLDAAGLSLVFVQGQHELSPEPWLSLMPGTCHLDLTDARVSLANLAKVYGIDYRPGPEFREELARVPEDCEILMCHQVWQEFMGEKAMPQASFADVPPHVKLLVTGDFHESHLKTFGNLTVLSPGSTAMQSISEPPEKFAWLLREDGKVEAVQLKTRHLVRSGMMAGEEDFAKFLQALAVELSPDESLPEELRKPLVRAKYLATIDRAEQRLRAAVGDRGHLFLDEVRPGVAERRERQMSRGKEPATLLTELPLAIPPDKRAASHALARTLLECPDGEEEATLRAWVGKELAEETTDAEV